MAEFVKYKPIVTKLRKKKSILRKNPNLNEVAEEVTQLGVELRNHPEYSGYCSLTASRIEHMNISSPNSIETEFDHLLDAARKFKQADEIVSAISCYRHAIKLCHESILYSLLFELATMYLNEGRFEEAAIEFKAAGDFRAAGNAYIQTRTHFSSALSCFERIKSQSQGQSEAQGQQEDPSTLKDDLVTNYLLKICVLNPQKLKGQIKFPIIGFSKSDEMDYLNLALESLLQQVQDGKFKWDGISKAAIYKNFNGRLNHEQKILLRYILEHKKLA